MALGHRQKRLYGYTVAVYSQNPVAIPQGGIKGDPSVTYKIKYGSIPCFLESTPEDDEPNTLGRTKEMTVFTTDRFHFDLALQLYDTDMIQLLTAPNPNFPLIGKWWSAHGNTRTHSWRANKQVLFLKRSTDPLIAP